jgi:hypothetical protein
VGSEGRHTAETELTPKDEVTTWVAAYDAEWALIEAGKISIGSTDEYELRSQIDRSGHGHWTPSHYAELFALRSALYYATHHWTRTSRTQRRQVHKCEICGSDGKVAHHLHYDTLGAEAVGKDLQTLCRACHDLVHGR